MHFPIDSLHDEFLRLLAIHHLVVESDTGSGKSTRLPLWSTQLVVKGRRARVLVIEPRRVACLALAEFVRTKAAQATLLQDELIKVDYAIRFDSTVTQKTQVAFVTPGVALRWLNVNGLVDFDVIIIDEFHERRWDTDILLAILKRDARHRLVLTSATIDTERLTTYLEQTPLYKAKCLKAEGRRFSIDLFYQAMQSHDLPELIDIENKVQRAISQVIEMKTLTGDILVFLPGKREILSCQQKCQSLLLNADFSSVVLHGGINHELQKKVLVGSSQRRVIFATNVAETSLTIPGVTAVIDSGLERRTQQRNGRTVLSLLRISHTSSEQRKGRAGRTQSGVCIRLWGSHAALEAITQPELQRNDLIEPMLAAAAAGYRLADLRFLDKLHEKTLLNATLKLVNMGAIDQEGQITAHGLHLFPLPIDTLFAHLISAMTDEVSRGLMIDLVAALSVGQKLFTLPSSPQDLQLLMQWEPFNCDASLLIKIMRASVPEFLSVDKILLAEAKQLANQIRSGLSFVDITPLMDSTIRQKWLLNVINAAPELAFVRREKRYQTLGNGYSEINIGRGSRFSSELVANDGKKSALAAVVFDQFSVVGKGVKQTVNFANCMAPISVNILVEAKVGEENVEDRPSKKRVDQVLFVRQYAGRVIGSRVGRVKGQQLLESIVGSMISGTIFPGLAIKIDQDIHAWNIWQELKKNQHKTSVDNFLSAEVSLTLKNYLKTKLIELGVESVDDLELIDVKDLYFEGIPLWERAEFDRLYPSILTLSALTLQAEYAPKNKLVTLHYSSGSRKLGPKRWELPRWSGWKIKYRKASRVVDVT
ncbi:helicase-related protein [Shewanella surugensis]|uniref:DEAD/DEAH box helicase n=1 Tax=Shewanella surugensis TaxID=212020 RepID=A0ABT0LFT5_9GAMM|nr:helicase-related protein [Shewanella surugensis]MCL1126220.1 DEAD/DEAH box helicase [Shewanella surugensis]